MNDETLKICRMVHMGTEDGCVPAIVVHVNDKDSIEAVAFSCSLGAQPCTLVRGTDQRIGWHWPWNCEKGL